MAQRVTLIEVQVLLRKYNDQIPMQPHVDYATALTDVVSSRDTLSVLTTALLKQIELNLAAHHYSLTDPAYLEKKTQDASAKFYGETGKGLDFTPWGQTAKKLDITGFLSSLGKGKSIGVTWLGTPIDDQLTFLERQ